MPRYRKKPVVVDAVQWFPGVEIPGGRELTFQSGPQLIILELNTLEGRMFAQPGDWIITGVKGERYACKPDIFRETYEEEVCR